jgi:hypothetical protein
MATRVEKKTHIKERGEHAIEGKATRIRHGGLVELKH